jgi:hypothetical protein
VAVIQLSQLIRASDAYCRWRGTWALIAIAAEIAALKCPVRPAWPQGAGLTRAVVRGARAAKSRGEVGRRVGGPPLPPALLSVALHGCWQWCHGSDLGSARALSRTAIRTVVVTDS